MSGVKGQWYNGTKMDFYSFAHTAFIYWLLFFIFGRSKHLMVQSWESPIVTTDFYIILYSLYLLINVFHVLKEHTLGFGGVLNLYTFNYLTNFYW
jgi:hypothetical protein